MRNHDILSPEQIDDIGLLFIRDKHIREMKEMFIYLKPKIRAQPSSCRREMLEYHTINEDNPDN